MVKGASIKIGMVVCMGLFGLIFMTSFASAWGNWQEAVFDFDLDQNDTTMPDKISSLRLIDGGSDFLEWAWDNPEDDFCGVVVFVDDVYLDEGDFNSVRIEGLDEDTEYKITVYTFDCAANVNWEGVSRSDRTLDDESNDDDNSVTGCSGRVKIIDEDERYKEWLGLYDSNSNRNGGDIVLDSVKQEAVRSYSFVYWLNVLLGILIILLIIILLLVFLARR